MSLRSVVSDMKPLAKPAGMYKHRRLMRGEDEAVDGQFAGGFVPIVDAHGADDGGSRHRGDVLGLALVAVPGADEALAIIGDGIEALHAGKVEVVDEAQFAAIVGSQASGHQDRFGGLGFGRHYGVIRSGA